jgi:hypothetical protein
LVFLDLRTLPGMAGAPVFDNPIHQEPYINGVLRIIGLVLPPLCQKTTGAEVCSPFISPTICLLFES